MKRWTVITILGLFAVSCQPVNHGTGEEDKLRQISWMLGKWQMQTAEGTITEEWRKPSDSQWLATSYMITAEGDTPFQETITLDYDDDSLVYSPLVSGQNEGSPVSFRERRITENEITFENLRHDFPQRIIYKRTSDSTIVATIEGQENGQTRRQEFMYTKVEQ